MSLCSHTSCQALLAQLSCAPLSVSQDSTVPTAEGQHVIRGSNGLSMGFDFPQTLCEGQVGQKALKGLWQPPNHGSI